MLAHGAVAIERAIRHGELIASIPDEEELHAVRRALRDVAAETFGARIGNVCEHAVRAMPGGLIVLVELPSNRRRALDGSKVLAGLGVHRRRRYGDKQEGERPQHHVQHSSAAVTLGKERGRDDL